METLQVATLPLLIAFIWLTSEVAAYPQPPEETDAVNNHVTKLNCGRSWNGQAEIRQQNGNPLGLSESTMTLIAPPDTLPLQQHRGILEGARSFDLDLNEARSLGATR